MKAIAFFILWYALRLSAIAQDISVTFTGTGAVTTIDSVKATNLKTNESVTLPGNATLVLTLNTGISLNPGLSSSSIAYPNPFTGKTTISAIVDKSQTVVVRIQNLFGQILAQLSTAVKPGENEFELSLNKAGIFFVSLIIDKEPDGSKIICTETNEAKNSIRYIGSKASQSGLKEFKTGYILAYSTGDIIHFKCTSGIYSSIFTDSPAYSRNYLVKFIGCSDPDGKNYPIVKIGDQFWMAENLSYLPSVNPPIQHSWIEPCFYVYDYMGVSVIEAKATENYTTYGALYNWKAAMNGASSSTSVPSGVKGICPDGWHLPSKSEWQLLWDYLTTNGFGWYGSGDDVAKALASSSTRWYHSIYADAPGNNDYPNNGCGFNALPGGVFNFDTWQNEGYFENMNATTGFWSTSEYNPPPEEYSWDFGLSSGRSYPVIEWLGNIVGLPVRCIKD